MQFRGDKDDPTAGTGHGTTGQFCGLQRMNTAEQKHFLQICRKCFILT
jgi:hypothetical protein